MRPDSASSAQAAPDRGKLAARGRPAGRAGTIPIAVRRRNR